MKQITPEIAQEVIDYFADKTLSFGCKVRLPILENCRKTKHSFTSKVLRKDGDGIIIFGDGDKTAGWVGDFTIQKILGHPILLDRIIELRPNVNTQKLVNLWKKYGIRKSLQELSSEKTVELFGFLHNK